MRGLCIALCALLAGCAAQQPKPDADDGPAISANRFDQLDYATLRGDDVADPAPDSPNPTLRLDLTLLEVDRALALEVLGLPDTHKFDPVSSREPVGEILAVRLLEEDRGEILSRPSYWLGNEPIQLNLQRSRYYLRDWELEGDTATPVIDKWREGVIGSVTVAQAGDSYSVSVETTSAQSVHPMPIFYAGTGPGSTVKIQIPELVSVKRVAVESIRRGETAAYFLSQAAYDETTRVRMLFVRLQDTAK
ncbi:MAG: hypothetical protein KDB82_05590 [Planctomycetes bacterium]|nr:hypothetical protein [Planctomycetota bacterium]